MLDRNALKYTHFFAEKHALGESRTYNCRCTRNALRTHPRMHEYTNARTCSVSQTQSQRSQSRRRVRRDRRPSERVAQAYHSTIRRARTPTTDWLLLATTAASLASLASVGVSTVSLARFLWRRRTRVADALSSWDLRSYSFSSSVKLLQKPPKKVFVIIIVFCLLSIMLKKCAQSAIRNIACEIVILKQFFYIFYDIVACYMRVK